MQHGAVLVLLALAFTGAASPDDTGRNAPTPSKPVQITLGPAPFRLLPDRTPPGPQSLLPGSIVASAIIGRPDSAILVAPLTLDRAGHRRSFAKGTVFASASVTGLDSLSGKPVSRVFCEAGEEGSIGKVLTGQMLFGLVGALRGTRLDTRYCVVDADEDGNFDHAFLIGAKGANRAPYAIAASEYGLIEGLPLGGESRLRIRYAGTAGEKERLAFDLEASGFGRMRTVPEPRRFIAIGKLPAHEVIAGAVVTVTAVDQSTGLATITVHRDLAPGHIALESLSPGG